VGTELHENGRLPAAEVIPLKPDGVKLLLVIVSGE